MRLSKPGYRSIKPLDLQHFVSPYTRALAWACFSAPLVNIGDHPALALTPERMAWLQSLDNDDQPLRKHLHERCKSPRLGLVFESLWHFFLEQDRSTELIAHNLPVRNARGRTLGEFDILYHDHTLQQRFHLELAVKFFLATRPGDIPLSAWLGPNSADRLDRKLERLQTHQLPLANSPEGALAMSNVGIEHCKAQLRVAGVLFYPQGKRATSACLNNDHPKGTWFSVQQFTTQKTEKEQATWRLLEKPHWLSADYQQTQGIEKALALATKRPQMLINQKLERCFVVPEHWPLIPNTD
ncbi:DUF1853 family protein [uncultured Spongiibacter sp.]|uniref:DUF1853 family protein n=1 Tax=Spongiibacter marinus TaxID=354246 RepID=UPI0025969F90|nr:DUF1853 family protein [uncultured Spongiibacter sp.]